MPKPDLENAYALKTAEDARQLYASWAESYDTDFVETHDFILPGLVASAFADNGGGGPVLDFGSGTGLVGENLADRGIGPVDATDLSPEMLAVAGRKEVYRNLIAGDIMAGLDLPDGIYAGIVSSGTFTHGHVGPDALDELLRLASPGALLALSINGAHFVAEAFAAKFDTLAGRIRDLDLPEVRFYGDRATGDHKDDAGVIACFRKV